MSDPTDPNVTAAKDQSASAAASADETAPQGAGAPKFGPPAAAGEVGVLGPYRVVKQLGAGGMGAVYLALDTRLDRKLALKVMLPAFAADRDAKERFLREAKAAAKVSHDNVVTVYEADERNGIPYIAMQFLQGYPLDEYLRNKGAPALAHVIRIARETALGLAAAHELGLVHRDIKPGNIWLEAPNGRVKVLDFGLAKPIGTEAELTRSGAVVGTPAYMSPEQARGSKVDARTDLFSLGALLYRLCTGKTPFDGPNVMAVLMALGSDDPAPVRERNPNVPESLAALIHQLLAKKPEQRPQTATEVAKRLRGILDQTLNPNAPTVVPGGAVPTASAADLSVSRPVVVNPVPNQPPIVVPMEVTAAPESAFANLTDDNDEEATHAEPAVAKERSARRPAAREPKKGGKGVLIGAAVAALLAVGVVAAVVSQMGNKGDSEVKAPDAPADANKGAKAAPRGWEPPKPGPVVAPGPSPFDALDPAKIPAAERGPWLPAGSVAVLGGHAGMHDSTLTPRAAALSPDGKWVAAANDTGVWIWDAATLRPRYYEPTYQQPALAFSPDGKTFAFGRVRPDGNGQMTRLIDLSGPEPRPLKDVAPHGENGTGAIAFLPDGKSLVTATGHGSIYLWDITGPGDKPTRVIRKEVGYQKGAVSQLTLSADGTKVIVVTDDEANKRQVIGGYALADGKELFSFPHSNLMFAVSPTGDRVVSLREVGGKWEAVVRDVTGPEPKELGTTPVPSGAEAMSFAPDGKTVFFAGWGWESLWELDGGTLRKVRDLPPGTIAVATDLSRVLQAKDRRVWLLDGDGKVLVQPGGAVTVNHGLQHLTVGAGGAVVTTFPNTRVWTVKDGALVAGTPTPSPNLGSTTASPDGAMMAALTGNTAIVYTVANGAIFREVRLHSSGVPEGEQVTWPYWHPDGKSLLTARKDGTFDLWDVTAAPPTKKPFSALGRSESLGAFAPAGDYIVVRKESDPGSPALRSLANPRADRTLPAFAAERWASAAFTPDGKTLLVGYIPEGNEREGRIRRFDVTKPNPTGELFAAFPWVHSQWPYFNLNVSRDGTKLLAYTGTQIRVFDLATRAELLSVPLTGGFGLLHSYTCWADNGRHLLLSSNNGMAYVLRVPDKSADRAAAEWVLSVGGKVGLKTAEGLKVIAPGTALPHGELRVARFDLSGCGDKVVDADLGRLAGLADLDGLILSQTAVTDAGVERLKVCRGLETLWLNSTGVGDTGVAHLKALTGLRNLHLGGTKVTDAGVQSLKPLTALREIAFDNTEVSDTGLEHLAVHRELEQVHAPKTKVTAAGAEKLAKALPKCLIEWDGGKIEPKK